MLEAPRTPAPASSVRRKRPLCALACGCEITSSISLSSSSRLAIRLVEIGWSCSPTIVTRVASKASASSVGRTAPSIEFSNGTSARSAEPSSTAITAAWMVAIGNGSSGAPPAALRRASSL